MPTELIIIIALIVVFMGGWAFVEYKWARRPLDPPPPTPTAPPSSSWRQRAGGPFLRGTGGARIKTPPVAKGKPKPVERHAGLFR